MQNKNLPRYKLLQSGINSLSDVELIATLIGTGTKDKPLLSLANDVLQHAYGNIHDLGKLGMHELMKVNGLGESKAAQIVTALELGRRRSVSKPTTKVQITTSLDSYTQFQSLSDLPHEEFWILLLRRNNTVIAKYQISIGGVSGTLVDSKILFKKALEHLASSVVLCHNHPSGNIKPSESDMKLTRKLIEAGKLLDILVIDHIIIGENGYYSFADEGML